MANQPFYLYSPMLPRGTNKMVPARELREQLVEFYTLYKPKNARGKPIDGYMEFARERGVLALRNILKRKYKCNLDDADASDAGWARIFTKLQEFYRIHNTGKPVDIERIFAYAKEKGLLALDEQLRTKYGESLSDFMRRGLDHWKRNWASVLQHSHAESVAYELRRFYNFIDTLPTTYPEKQPLDVLVNWATNHSRIEVNEKLLNKYQFGLDDVKMIPGTTNEERVINLKFQLIEFYQKYDPEKLGNSADNEESPEMQALERDAQIGIFRLEQLDEKLKREYGYGLEDNFTKELRQRLIEFYKEVGADKSLEQIDKVVEFAAKRGLHAMNEKLSLAYGYGVPIDDL